MHRFLLHNDDIRDAGDFSLSPGQVGLLSGWGVFSTLRVYDGVMFAFERHWERMRRDAARMRVPFPAQPELLESRLQRLIEANQAAPGQPLNATLRVVVVRNRGGLYEGPGITRDFDVIAFTVDMVRWPETVKLGRHSQRPPCRQRICGNQIHFLGREPDALRKGPPARLGRSDPAQRARRSRRMYFGQRIYCGSRRG